MPRVEPITDKSDVPAEYQEVVEGVLEVFGQIRGPFSMLLHAIPRCGHPIMQGCGPISSLPQPLLVPSSNWCKLVARLSATRPIQSTLRDNTPRKRGSS